MILRIIHDKPKNAWKPIGLGLIKWELKLSTILSYEPRGGSLGLWPRSCQLWPRPYSLVKNDQKLVVVVPHGIYQGGHFSIVSLVQSVTSLVEISYVIEFYWTSKSKRLPTNEKSLFFEFSTSLVRRGAHCLSMNMVSLTSVLAYKAPDQCGLSPFSYFLNKIQISHLLYNAFVTQVG